MTDTDYIRRAIANAMLGRGGVEPNPMVGCVIVKDGRIIGQGHHRRYGGPHAEPDALSSCVEDPAGGTAYVTLEPCRHHRKQTPPCVPRLIGAKLARVVVGCSDPNPAVNGKGVAELRAAGVEVTAPVLEAECRQLVAPFLARVVHGRPYVTLKWAQSSDGNIAAAGGKPARISNAETTAIVHHLRARCDGILVGVNTVISDDPLLTARDVPTTRPLRRYVLDGEFRLPKESRLARTGVTVFHRAGLDVSAGGVEAVGVPVEGSGLHLAAVVSAMPEVSHLLVEPGPRLAAGFFAANLADRVWVITGQPKLPGGVAAATLPAGFVRVGKAELDGDTIEEWLNTRGDVFYSATTSADWVVSVEGRLAAVSDGRGEPRMDTEQRR